VVLPFQAHSQPCKLPLKFAVNPSSARMKQLWIRWTDFHENLYRGIFMKIYWHPTAVSRVRSQVGCVGFMVDKMTLEQVFSEYFGPTCQFSFSQQLPVHLFILSHTLWRLDTDSVVKQQKKENERKFMPVCLETLFFGYNDEFIWTPTCVRSRNSAVGIATGYRLEDRGVGVRIPGRVKNFLLSKSSRPSLGSTQPSIQWVPGALSPE
jgi:hypothetical protein